MLYKKLDNFQYSLFLIDKMYTAFSPNCLAVREMHLLCQKIFKTVFPCFHTSARLQLFETAPQATCECAFLNSSAGTGR